MKPVVKALGIVTLLGSMVAGGYYFLVVRPRKPQVELYFDDGSMLAMPGNTGEAEPFMKVATEILAANPVAS